MRTIAVIGLTNLGVTLARLLAATNRVDRLVFLDQDDQIAVGLATDLAASPAPHCEVVIQDPAALKAADVLVVTIGQRFLANRIRLRNWPATSKQFKNGAPPLPKVALAGWS